ncbi:MAG: hypothetical protein IJW82_08255 [Clostridia bacterium]|nr:hypothetical protein [Clostridia bacterium]
MCLDSVSEIRMAEYEGFDQDFWVSFSCGYREDPYIIDGKKGDMIDYGVIKLVFFDFENNLNLSFFSLSINNDDYIVELEQNPFDNSLMADIKICVKEKSYVFANVKYGEVQKIIKMEEFISDFKIDNMKALSIFINSNKEIINEAIQNNVLVGEFHISILEKVSFDKNIKYWYINFFNGKQDYKMCIDPYNAEKNTFLLGKKKSIQKKTQIIEYKINALHSNNAE